VHVHGALCCLCYAILINFARQKRERKLEFQVRWWEHTTITLDAATAEPPLMIEPLKPATISNGVASILGNIWPCYRESHRQVYPSSLFCGCKSISAELQTETAHSIKTDGQTTFTFKRCPLSISAALNSKTSPTARATIASNLSGSSANFPHYSYSIELLHNKRVKVRRGHWLAGAGWEASSFAR